MDKGENEEICQKEVYQGEVRCIIISKNGKTPFGFICNHNYREDGFNKDIFFSFKSIDSKDKINVDDPVSFKMAKNGSSSKIWAVQVRKIKEINNEVIR